MKPIEQRITIAQACGWKLVKATELTEGGLVNPEGIWVRRFWKQDVTMYFIDLVSLLPDYCNDLNAMFEAEEYKLEDWDNYENELSRITDRLWHATASQRAEAFLKTINKWTAR